MILELVVTLLAGQVALASVSAGHTGNEYTITIDRDTSHAVSPLLYGIFFEEVSCLCSEVLRPRHTHATLESERQAA